MISGFFGASLMAMQTLIGLPVAVWALLTGKVTL